MGAGMITDEVIDAIAHIEMHRQEMEKEAGISAACNEALRKLHELLDRKKEALQLHGAGAGHPADVEAVAREIERVKRLAGTSRRGAISKHPRGAGQKPASQPGGPHNPPRNRGRRRMGRRGGR